MFQRVLICGDRNWSHSGFDAFTFANAMRKWVATHGMPSIIIEGCARGADRAAEIWAMENHVQIEHYAADWDRFGRSAGPRRNEQMLRDGKPHAVIAFHRDLASSKGTGHMVKIARAAYIPVWVPVRQPSPDLPVQQTLFTL